MKQHYEKVKHMSVALHKKEETRADLVQRLQNSSSAAGAKDNAIVSMPLGGLPVVYASAAVYATVLYWIVSIIFKF